MVNVVLSDIFLVFLFQNNLIMELTLMNHVGFFLIIFLTFTVYINWEAFWDDSSEDNYEWWFPTIASLIVSIVSFLVIESYYWIIKIFF